MNNKWMIIGEVLIVIIALGYYAIKEILPNYREVFGSSGSLINTITYINMFEFNIDDSTNFSVAVSNKNKISHLFFYSTNSICLYNKNIEGNNYEEGLTKIVESLIENNLLSSNSVIEVTRYGDVDYSEFKDELIKKLQKYGININIVENTKTLEEKAQELNIDYDNTSQDIILIEIDLYSKEIVNGYKFNYDTGSEDKLNTSDIKSLSNKVYRKIEDYVISKNISSTDKNNMPLDITLIPADRAGQYYPDSNSWYYTLDGKVYAYIEFLIDDNKTGFCYKGSVDLISEGECL